LAGLYVLIFALTRISRGYHTYYLSQYSLGDAGIQLWSKRKGRMKG